MTKFQLWLLRRLVRRVLVTFQLPMLMKIVSEEHERFFYEDNAPTRYSHIVESVPQ